MRQENEGGREAKALVAYAAYPPPRASDCMNGVVLDQSKATREYTDAALEKKAISDLSSFVDRRRWRVEKKILKRRYDPYNTRDRLPTGGA